MKDINKYRRLKYSVANIRDNVTVKKGTICEIICKDVLPDQLILAPIYNKYIQIHCWEEQVEKLTKDELMVELL